MPFTTVYKIDKDALVFTPTRHAKKPDRGFSHEGKDQEIEIQMTSSDEDIFNALQQTLARCEQIKLK